MKTPIEKTTSAGVDLTLGGMANGDSSLRKFWRRPPSAELDWFGDWLLENLETIRIEAASRGK